MSIHLYFKKKPSVLPNPNGSLSSRIPSKMIAIANNEVKPLIEEKTAKENNKLSRGKYSVYTEEEKLKVGKRAAEMGTTNTIRHFNKMFKDRPLKESTV